MNKKHKLYLIMLTIGGIIIMAALNYDQSNFMSLQISKVIQKIANALDNNHYTMGQINLVVRKFGHLIEYLFLMVICYSILHSHLNNSIYVFVLSFLIIFIIAGLDEGIIQRLLASGRNGQAYDLIIDIFGATIGYANIKLYQFLTYENLKLKK